MTPRVTLRSWALFASSLALACAAAAAPPPEAPTATPSSASASMAPASRDKAELPDVKGTPQHSTAPQWHEVLTEAETPRDAVDRQLTRIRDRCDRLHPNWNATIDAAAQTVEFAFDIPSAEGGVRAFRGAVKLALGGFDERRVLTILPQTTVEVYLVRDGMIWDVDDRELRLFTRQIQDLLTEVHESPDRSPH